MGWPVPVTRKNPVLREYSLTLQYHCIASHVICLDSIVDVQLTSYLHVWLNPNQSNRRSAILQWYLPLRSNWVFSVWTIPNVAVDSDKYYLCFLLINSVRKLPYLFIPDSGCQTCRREGHAPAPSWTWRSSRSCRRAARPRAGRIRARKQGRSQDSRSIN